MREDAGIAALWVGLVLAGGCGSGRGGDDDDNAGDGDGDSDVDGDAEGDPERRCLDADGQPTDTCALDPDRQPCELDETGSCGILTIEEVWADDGETGSCLRLVIENRCDEVLYSWTCIEHDDPVEWQCWLSTTSPGFDVDVSQCRATGRYAHYGSLSDGTLDIIHARCDPDP